MAKVSKEHILAEIRRTAQENGGPAVGQRRFEEVSGIPPHAWRGKYWRAWSDAVVEAGLAANTARQPHDPVALILAFVALIRRLGRFPTEADMRLERERDAGFPSMMSFRKWIGGQPDRIEAVRKYAGERSECSDVLEILPLPQPDDDGETTTMNSVKVTSTS
ncbi:MAG: hypothetical protein ABI867_31745 [Kofleriaceae bacterium]